MYQPSMYSVDWLILWMLRGASLAVDWLCMWERALRSEPPPYIPLKTLTNAWDGRQFDLTGFDGTSGNG